ncbi:MAG: hypothetical protein QW270_04755 [Candidatus Bathyarchaeia archaeon]
MKAKLLVSLLLAVLLVQAYTCALAVADDSPVEVAVYIENRIKNDGSKLLTLQDALEVVEARFKDQLGYAVDFKFCRWWESRKDIDDPLVLLQDALSKAGGIRTREYDNYGTVQWRFNNVYFACAIYVVDQDLDGDLTGGVAVLNWHAAILDLVETV